MMKKLLLLLFVLFAVVNAETVHFYITIIQNNSIQPAENYTVYLVGQDGVPISIYQDGNGTHNYFITNESGWFVCGEGNTCLIDNDTLYTFMTVLVYDENGTQVFEDERYISGYTTVQIDLEERSISESISLKEIIKYGMKQKYLLVILFFTLFAILVKVYRLAKALAISGAVLLFAGVFLKGYIEFQTVIYLVLVAGAMFAVGIVLDRYSWKRR